MDGDKLIGRMKRLADVKNIKEVTPLSSAIFPGSHCPLMGAMMAVKGIRDSILLVVGTDECTYYTKNTTISNSAFGGLDGRCLSVVLDQHDITFGCRDKLYDAFSQLMEEYSPKAVFIVTTCVVEITGDDVDSMAEDLGDIYRIPVMAVHTEHFKTENHLPGIRDTITACFSMMEARAIEKTVNVIGQRMGDFSTTELYRVLEGAGVSIGMKLPGGTTVEEIREAAAARVNIVVNPIGLPLAKKMESAFGTPYVLFDKYIDPERIYSLYGQLFTYLELPLPEKVKQLYVQAAETVARAESELRGITYIYGNTPVDCFELNAFMTKIGMEPLLIQTNAIPEKGDEKLEAILERYNPYVTKTANIAPLQYVYDVLKPNLYLGHEYGERLRAKGIEIAHMDLVSPMLGMETAITGIGELVRASRAARELEKGRNIR
ncbi:nitrogenase molybdenum-cofactor synthesis protein NifE [Catenibacillus scindens]|uniref:Nitrogenase molybdenum-cofactor synthesis protein NifE n=1 Tax=Catenibacillus scindens TaxID=673271 RepID=A0A7W8HBJ6_9FIRM|nr:nitrogenase component 1 [Catenibacillus scindens]MBB5265245.1 nitrogenase molybdenum-cofactor synthesis protein NifE [Catenibacillus scindens]